MRKYILKRILLSIVIFFFVMLIIYVLMRCLPTSYIENIARSKSQQPGSKSYEEWMEQLTAMYNMDKGIIGGIELTREGFPNLHIVEHTELTEQAVFALRVRGRPPFCGEMREIARL